MSFYNIAILGDGLNSEAIALRRWLLKAFRDLGIARRHVRFLNASDIRTASRSLPLVATLFCTASSAEDVAAALDAQARGAPVIPAVSDLGSFKAVCPEALQGHNGIAVGGDLAGLPRLGAAILEWLGLLRRQRRLFLSYRRDQSREAALALYDSLQGAGFDVFLDTHDVRPGDDFQSVLMHRLSDCEIVVLLDTPGFLERRWTVEELARANLLGLGILQLVWPHHNPPRKSPIGLKHQLIASDLLGATGPIRTSTLRSIVNLVEDLRAHAVAARTAALAGEFRNEAVRAGARVTTQPDRTLRAAWDDGRVLVAVPTLGVPAADRYHAVFEAAQAKGEETPILVYDSIGILDTWLDHLTWLDSHLPIRAIRVDQLRRELRR